MEGGEKKICFVIMPFRVRETDIAKYVSPNHWDEVYEGLIWPAVVKAGLACDRDDIDIGSRLISENILLKVEKADLILCDLSSSNPNVFLEIGWAFRSDKPFILIKDNLTDYQFDLNQYYTFEYDHSLQPIALKSEVEKLAQVVTRTQSDRSRRYSLVSKLSISLSAIEAAAKGDRVTGMLLEMRDQLTRLQFGPLTYGPSPTAFLFPGLAKIGLNSLYSIKKELEKASLNPQDRQGVKDIMLRLVSDYGIYRKMEIQCSLIDPDKYFLFHDHEDMIGQEANKQAIEGFNIYDEVFKHPAGAVAWSDKGTNLPGREVLRHNLGLWTKLEIYNWRIFIELHHEMEGGR